VGNRPVTGRTTYLDEEGQTTVVLEYPAKTLNVAHGSPAWQVDAGPILVPDLRAPRQVPDLLAGRFDVAYLVFNSWDRAEVAVRRPVELGRAGGRAIATAHYADIRVLEARNELFAAGG
jgi:hypothetical protein